MSFRTKRSALAGGAALSLILSQTALAEGTTAGTAVNNTATVQYSVGGVAQPEVASNTTSFLVDKRINLTLAEVGGVATVVAPGSQSQITTFTVTNTTNGAADFRLSATQDATGTNTVYGTPDTFDGANLRIFVDLNRNGTYDPAIDTATFLDEMPADSTRTVFVIVDIPAGTADPSTAGVTLTATAAEPGTNATLGADSVQTAGADTPGAVDTVFGDAAGKSDAARDGKFSDRDAYRVASATISLVKTQRIVSDPFNGAQNPKVIPGAVVEYCLQIRNTGSETALQVALNDPLAENLTYETNSLMVGGSVSGGVCNADGTTEDDDAVGADESDPSGGSFSNRTVRTVLQTVPPNSTTTARFRVAID